MRHLLIGCAFLLAACNPEPKVLKLSGETMGTTYNIIAIDKDARLKTQAVASAVEITLKEVNAKMSNWDPASEVSVFNAQTTTEPVEISAEFATVMTAANLVHDQSGGQFDVTLGPLIELWGFGARNSESPIPSDAEIAKARAAVGQTSILTLSQDPATLTKSLPDTSVYLAAIAKGFGVDEVAHTLSTLGLTDYMVEIGGDLVTAGQNPDGDAWKIGIERPDAQIRAIESVVDITNHGMATSGDYRNYFEENGIRYSHIIDAQTGRPITHNTASVTVLAENAMMADAWATALLALGSERGLEIAQKLELAALFIDRDFESDTLRFTSLASPRYDALQHLD